METVNVNLVAVVVSAVVYMVLGFLWYGPLFDKQWMKLVGVTDKDVEAAKTGMGKTYGIMFVGALVRSYVLAYVVAFAGAVTLGAGAQTGFWMWLGFVATTALNSYLFDPKPKSWSLYWLDQGYMAVSLMVTGALLATWA